MRVFIASQVHNLKPPRSIARRLHAMCNQGVHNNIQNRTRSLECGWQLCPDRVVCVSSYIIHSLCVQARSEQQSTTKLLGYTCWATYARTQTNTHISLSPFAVGVCRCFSVSAHEYFPNCCRIAAKNTLTILTLSLSPFAHTEPKHMHNMHRYTYIVYSDVYMM